MYKTILVPLDGSKRAEAILPHVESLAQCLGAKAILLGVVELRPVVVGPDAIYPTLDLQNYEQRAKEMETYLTARGEELLEKGIQVQMQVGYGPVVEEIINVAEHEKVDLIAMASHGRTGLSRVFYGSVAAGVLHRVNRPLLLIRSQDNQ